MIGKWFRLFAVAAVGLAAGAAAANPYNLPEPQTIVAREIYDLHTLIMWIVVGIFVVVFGAMIYAIIRHRKSAGRQAQQFHENTTVEIVWTIIPFFILIGMAYPAIKTLIAMKDTSRPELTIKAAMDPAKQWTLVELGAHGEKIYAATGEAVTPAEVKSLRKSARNEQAAWRSIVWS
jgi:cytochrome c oxidase subunit 2